MQKITDTTINYLKGQLAAGADMLQLFDSWAGVLSPEQYNEFSLKYIAQICNGLSQQPAASDQPIITVFAKDAHFARKQMRDLNCSVIGLDWTMDIAGSKELIGPGKTLQGNMDPCLLYADMATIKKETVKMLNAFGPRNHIANLGHGLYPDLEVDKVKCFIDTVKEHRF